MITLNFIVNNDIKYPKHKIPKEINDIVEIKYMKKDCGNIASKTIIKLNSLRIDPLLGGYSDDGIMEMLEDKEYVCSNGMDYERSRRNGVSNLISYHCPLMLYYLKQEKDFRRWYGSY